MPLREDLLNPIPGDNPSGKNLRYDRVTDQVKEARTEDDSTLPAGVWERQVKRADYKTVVKLAGEALATKSKDLQMAVWLGEAHIKMEGAALLQPVLELLLNLQKEFWPTIYPEIDEGDAGLRAVPLQWAANRYAVLVYELPLTKSGISFPGYKAARAIGYEADAVGNDAKKKNRQDAIARGGLTSEDVDAGIAETPKSFYAALDEHLQGSRDLLEDLAIYSEEQYADDGPTYRKLRDSLDEVHNLVNSLLTAKRAVEPDPVAVPEPEPEPEPVPAAVQQAVVAAPVAAPVQPVAVAVAQPAVAAPAATPVVIQSAAGFSAAPKSWDDASDSVQSLATYMHGQRPGSSVPYLLQTAIRWGELRREGPKPPLSLLVAPTSDQRSGLKMAASEKAWGDVLGRGMAALPEPCARVWLDLHRYLWQAATQSGYKQFADAIVYSVRQILTEYPDMPQWTFMDDTAVANADTLTWVEETVLAGADAPQPVQSSAPAPPPAPAPVPVAMPVPVVVVSDDGTTDAFVQAAELAAAGQLGAATQLLARDAAGQSSGRMRYSRRMQIAELCLAGGNSGVATPILRELIAEMERRNLESWESGDLITKPIALLLHAQNGSMDPAERESLFTRLCRFDPSAALDLG